MQVETTPIDGVLLINPIKHVDKRGSFSETYRKSALADAGFKGGEFVQDNHVHSFGRGILRGLHFQSPPHGQDKLVSCLRGAIFDVAVDIRRGSPTFGAWVGAILTEENCQQILVPQGFAHGYCTLSEICEVYYKVTGYYNKDAEGSLFWNDPAVSISWPIDPAIISTNERDAAAPRLSAFQSPFD